LNSAIANLLKTLVEGLAVSDKVAGLVRAIPYTVREGNRTVVKYFPLGCDVTDPEACTEQEVRDLVPDGSKRSIIYFEDMGWSRQKPHPPGAYRYTSRLRMVVWMNTKLIGDQCTIADSVQQDLIDAIEVERYNADPFQQIQHRAYSAPPVSNAIFSKYTYNESERQFLTWPYSYFAIDIETTFILPIGCKIPVTPVPVPC
jgi:hypothetical protein